MRKKRLRFSPQPTWSPYARIAHRFEKRADCADLPRRVSEVAQTLDALPAIQFLTGGGRGSRALFHNALTLVRAVAAGVTTFTDKGLELIAKALGIRYPSRPKQQGASSGRLEEILDLDQYLLTT